MNPWLARASCRGLDVSLFFPAERRTKIATFRVQRRDAAEALAVCEACAVRRECLADALAGPARLDLGIRGGLVEGERVRLRLRMGLPTNRVGAQSRALARRAEGERERSA